MLVKIYLKPAQDYYLSTTETINTSVEIFYNCLSLCLMEKAEPFTIDGVCQNKKLEV